MSPAGDALADDTLRWASEMRKDCLRMAVETGSAGSHIGGALSLVEILAVLYSRVMKVTPNDPLSPKRDRLILSKGHGAMAYYAALSRAGYLAQEELLTFKSNSTRLYGHPSRNQSFGIEFSSGSLGLGLSLGVGVALGLLRRANDESRVFVVMGDGECNEGSVWEAAASASHLRLSNVVVIIDRNGLQYDGDTRSVLHMGDLQEKWSCFGWDAVVVDGHDVQALDKALNRRCSRPLAVIADTVKGKGISFMEGNAAWHHSRITQEQFERAMTELGAQT